MTSPDDSISVRFATVEDVPLIHALICELAEYERLADAVTSSPAQLAEAIFGGGPGPEVLIASHEGAPVGFALFFHTFSTFLGKRGMYLEDLFVRPAHRGRGAGKALFGRVAQLAVERGCGRFEWAVLDWNEPAIGFYKSTGAIPMSEWTTFRLAGQELTAFVQRLS